MTSTTDPLFFTTGMGYIASAAHGVAYPTGDEIGTFITNAISGVKKLRRKQLKIRIAEATSLKFNPSRSILQLLTSSRYTVAIKISQEWFYFFDLGERGLIGGTLMSYLNGVLSKSSMIGVPLVSQYLRSSNSQAASSLAVALRLGLPLNPQTLTVYYQEILNLYLMHEKKTGTAYKEVAAIKKLLKALAFHPINP